MKKTASFLISSQKVAIRNIENILATLSENDVKNRWNEGSKLFELSANIHEIRSAANCIEEIFNAKE